MTETKSVCSFCRRKIGEGTHDRVLETFEAMGDRTAEGVGIKYSEMAERVRKMPNRAVQLLLPGPGDIQICDICVELYADTARRELAARG